MLFERRELRPNLVDGPGRVPCVRPFGDRAERLLRAGAPHQDREMGLDGARLAERVLEPVEAALVRDSLAVEEPAEEHDGLVQAVEARPDARAELLEPERLVLAVEPRATDPEHRPSPAQVVDGRGDLRGEPR